MTVLTWRRPRWLHGALAWLAAVVCHPLQIAVMMENAGPSPVLLVYLGLPTAISIGLFMRRFANQDRMSVAALARGAFRISAETLAIVVAVLVAFFAVVLAQDTQTTTLDALAALLILSGVMSLYGLITAVLAYPIAVLSAYLIMFRRT